MTLLFIIWQPRGLQIGTSAVVVVGAIVALVIGVVSFEDVITVTSIVDEVLKDETTCHLRFFKSS